MNITFKIVLASFFIVVCLPLSAAPREQGKADNGAVQKLQAMVKSLTAERDATKAEAAKTSAELEQAKKDLAANATAIKTAVAAKEQSDGELNAQKTSNTEVRERLEQTNTRLVEVIEKYKALMQAKNQLSEELQVSKGKQEATEQTLVTCQEHNVKLYESGKELLERYQTKGTISGLLQDEPLLQFNSVEMENILQEYEDKLRAGQVKAQ